MATESRWNLTKKKSKKCGKGKVSFANGDEDVKNCKSQPFLQQKEFEQEREAKHEEREILST